MPIGATVNRVTVEVPARVGAPLQCRSEEKVVSGAINLTPRELPGESFDSGHRRSLDQPSTSRGTDVLDTVLSWQVELLDFEDDQDVEEGEIWRIM
ncbi:hypothetical protein NDU88_005949 [Pleurodeles waltl]|uniref:Uncharacterized protein n=1 Tax=Pleurodeles waltl TaxID=8319 RepID=A0AAV7SN64_PLEWA|nr:hypothetical protein NDU88_005949 [Pleurodeles waltl]